MTFENDKTLDEIEQIKARLESDLKLLEEMAQSNPELTEQLTHLRDKNLTELAEIEEIAARVKAENDGFGNTN